MLGSYSTFTAARQAAARRSHMPVIFIDGSGLFWLVIARFADTVEANGWTRVD